MSRSILGQRPSEPESTHPIYREAGRQLRESPAWQELASNAHAELAYKAAVANALVQSVDFPAFVAELIRGVFNAIVDAFIQQMDAYSHLVADVAASVEGFRDEAITLDQARDYLVNLFPDLLEFDDECDALRKRLHWRDGVDQDLAWTRLGTILLRDDMPAVPDDEVLEAVVVPATRRQLASARQQILATMVLMGVPARR